MRILLLFLLLACPALAMFDGMGSSPDGRYHAMLEGNQLVVRFAGKILWRAPSRGSHGGIQVSDLGQVVFRTEQEQVFFDPQGREVVRVPTLGWGWFSRDGSRYFSHLDGHEQLCQLDLRPGAHYREVNNDTLIVEVLDKNAPQLDVLCALAGRGLELPESTLAGLDREHAAWWRARRSPKSGAPLEACLFSTPEAYWQRARYAPEQQLSTTLGLLLRNRGAAARRATARQWERLSPVQLDCVLRVLRSETPATLGPLRAPLQKLARQSSSEGMQAVVILLKRDGLKTCLPYLHNRLGAIVVLNKLLEQREVASVPILIELLEKYPENALVLQALRFQCRVGLAPNPELWRKWCSQSSHSLEARLAVQTRDELRGFLLASWKGQLSLTDFAHVPRLVRVNQPRLGWAPARLEVSGPGPQRFCLRRAGSATRPIPGEWLAMQLVPGQDRLLARSSPEYCCLLDLSGRRLTPDRRIEAAGVLSRHGAYILEQGVFPPKLVEMASGREIPLPEGDLTFAPDERRLVVSKPESLRVYELPSGRFQREAPFASPQFLEWLPEGLRVLDESGDYLYRFDALPTPEALQSGQQRLLAELWTGQRLQGGLPVRLTRSEWLLRRDRWQALFGPF